MKMFSRFFLILIKWLPFLITPIDSEMIGWAVIVFNQWRAPYYAPHPAWVMIPACNISHLFAISLCLDYFPLIIVEHVSVHVR